MCLSFDLHCIPYSICCFGWSNQENRWARYVARMWEGWGAYSVLMRRPEGWKPLWRPRHEWENKSIEMNLHAVGWRGRDWIAVAEDRDRWRVLADAAIKLRAALNAGNFLSIWELVSFSGRTRLRRDSYSTCYICDVGVGTAGLARVGLVPLVINCLREQGHIFCKPL